MTAFSGFLAPVRQWLFRFGRDERLPVVLTQRRIFIVPTRSGMLFAVVLIVMLIGAINYNLSLGHALVFLLAGLSLAAMVHTFRNLIDLRLTPGRAEPIFAGDTARFTISLENPRLHDRRALELAFGRNATVTIDLPAGERIATSIPCPAPARGLLDPGRITLSTCYPLGLFYAWSYPHPPLSCLVYPKPLESPLPLRSTLAISGEQQGDRGQEDFSGLRLRQASDSPRHIAWKAVARDFEHRPLLVKQFSGGTSIELWLDWALTPEGSDMETRLSLLTGWILAAELQHLRYGLRLPGHELLPNQGQAHRNRCLEILALHGKT